MHTCRRASLRQGVWTQPCGLTRLANTHLRPFGTPWPELYDLGMALSCLFFSKEGLGSALAIAIAAADSPVIRASAEVDRNLRYHRASGGSDVSPFGSPTSRIVSGL